MTRSAKGGEAPEDAKATNDEMSAVIEAELEKSKGRDIPVLLRAKGMAQRAVADNPSNANLATLQRATEMLENAMKQKKGDEALNSPGEVLAYLQELGKQIEKTKLYDDIKAGLLKKTNRKFKRADVDRYAIRLPMASTPVGLLQEAEERQRRKDEADIRIKEATARREEIKTAALEGRYMLREYVDQELASKAAALQSDLSSQIEANAALLVDTAKEGSRPLAAAIIDIANRCFDVYSYPIDLEVDMDLRDEDDDQAPKKKADGAAPTKKAVKAAPKTRAKK